VHEIAPGPRDILIQKQKPSAFYATPLQSYLTLLCCDSLLVTGATTSGCVRASVLDAFSGNYRVAVVQDACFDRSQASHAVSLCDMHAKYADVIDSAEVIDFMFALPAAMFDLPAGEPAMQSATSRP
jgi:maleamate amidohydrolase